MVTNPEKSLSLTVAQENRVHDMSILSAYLGPVRSSCLQSSSQNILTISQLVLRHIYILLSNRIGFKLILSIFLFFPFMSVPGFHPPLPPSLHLDYLLDMLDHIPAPLWMQPPDIIHADKPHLQRRLGENDQEKRIRSRLYG